MALQYFRFLNKFATHIIFYRLRSSTFNENIWKWLKIEQKYKHTASVVFLHGLGDSGPSVRTWMKPHIQNFDLSHISFVFPTAPVIYYTPYNEKMNAWFNKYDLDYSSSEHAESLNSISIIMKKLIDSKVSSGISVDRIIVGGFSMGGALALHLGYRWVPEVAGVFALSSFLQKNSAVFDELQNLSNPAPIYMCHGDRDDIIALELGENTYNKLTQLGVNGNFYTIPGMEHDVEDNEIEDLLKWISKILPP